VVVAELAVAVVAVDVVLMGQFSFSVLWMPR
jgi:hypothetical protein